MILGRQQHWVETRDDYLDIEDLTLHVEPTERVGAPLPTPHKSRLKRMLVGIVLIAGAWAAMASDLTSHSLVAAAKPLFDAIVSTAQEIASHADQEATPASAAMSSTMAPTNPGASDPPVEQIGGTELLPELAPAQDEKTAPAASETLPTKSIGTAYGETATPAEEAQDRSPKRKRAIAAGLGPDLPNVLLTRLSKDDLRNAAYAIETALSKTSDDASFAWPPSPSRQQALFEVRFVPGASQGCRRYIVTVTKDRWSSTSAALEKCGGIRAHAG